ncbi:MAG: NifB/NifX family molybdenum-iron cluster-binding protein [Actinomycetes bacterium]
MIVCVPVTTSGTVDPSWGRADRIAVAEIVDGAIINWNEYDTFWNTLHDEGTHGSHHARIAKFLKEHKIEAVFANHMGDGMVRMLATMQLPTHLGAAGDAREAVLVR